MEKCSGIYRIDCKHECIYVGQSVNLHNRESSHLRKLRKGTHYNVYLQRLYDKYKSEFVFTRIEKCVPELLTEREMFWISKLKPKCNMQIPSDSTYFTVTEDARKKMSEISKKRMTPEMKAKISEETRKAMHRSDVWENFMNGQRNKKNKTPWNKGLKGVQVYTGKKVYCKELNMYFSSATEAARYVRANNPKGVSRVCRGERNKYKNMHFEYVNE